jgi:predicted DNA-binding transcriptional regulator AlpA
MEVCIVADMLTGDPKHHRLPEMITSEEVAGITRTTPETVRYWRYIGKGPKSFKLGRRVLYAREDVERWIAEQREQQGARRSGLTNR